MSSFRNGAIGALLDVYQIAISNFIDDVALLPESAFSYSETILYSDTSLPSIIKHTINAGYIYADYIRELFGIQTSPQAYDIRNINDVKTNMEKMLAYTVEALDGKSELDYNEIREVSISVSWGPVYDLEMLLEHAIVHICRHGRQIKIMLSSLNQAAL